MEPMNLNFYQDCARKTAQGHNLDHFVHGLTEEAGEVAGVMKRFHRGDDQYGEPGHGPNSALPALSQYARDKLVAELGDVLWYVAMIADIVEVRLEDVAIKNVQKLLDRKKRNVITGSGDDR